MKTTKLTSFLIILVCLVCLSCQKRGCKEQCASNYSSKAEKEGHCKGCTDQTAINYCPGADSDDGSCLYQIKFYTKTDFDSIWVWVSDSTINCTKILCDNWCSTPYISWEGTIIKVYNQTPPNCGTGDSTVVVVRPAGVYWYEYELLNGSGSYGKCVEFGYPNCGYVLIS